MCNGESELLIILNTLFNEDAYLTIANIICRKDLKKQNKYKKTTLQNNYKKNNYKKENTTTLQSNYQ